MNKQQWMDKITQDFKRADDLMMLENVYGNIIIPLGEDTTNGILPYEDYADLTLHCFYSYQERLLYIHAMKAN